MARVAVLQLPSSSDHDRDLELCLALIARAASQHGAQIVVCPELVVTAGELSERTSSVRERLDAVLSSCARQHAIWLVTGLAMRGSSECALFDAAGERVARAGDLEPASGSPERALAETPFGQIGLCAGPEVLSPQSVRALVLAGAELICASLGASAPATISLRISARAAENQAFVAVAGRSLARDRRHPPQAETLPPELPPLGDSLQATSSQIVAPNGRALAVATAESPALAVAALELEQARRKQRADGSSLLSLRRPELYRKVSSRWQPEPRERERHPSANAGRARELVGESLSASAGRAPARDAPSRRTPGRARPAPRAGESSQELSVAAIDFEAPESLARALQFACDRVAELSAQGTRLVVLPELFCFDLNLSDAAEAAAHEFASVGRALATACGRVGTHVVTSLPECVGDAIFHTGVVIGAAGIVARQPQLHVPQRHAWAQPGRRLQGVRMPWGTLAIAVGEDALMSELASLFALIGADLVVAPLSSPWCDDAALTLLAYADEQGYGVVGAMRSADGSEPAPTRCFIVDPTRWPAQRALAGQRVVRGTIWL